MYLKGLQLSLFPFMLLVLQLVLALSFPFHVMHLLAAVLAKSKSTMSCHLPYLHYFPFTSPCASKMWHIEYIVARTAAQAAVSFVVAAARCSMKLGWSLPEVNFSCFCARPKLSVS